MTWDTPFASLLQSITSKTFITQQKFLYSIHQDAGEFHTSVHLKVGGLEHTEEVELGKNVGSARNPGPPAMVAEPTTLENPAASGEVAQMTPASWPQWCWWPQRNGQQWHWGLWPHPPPCRGTHHSNFPPCSGGTVNLTTPGVADMPVTPNSLQSSSNLLPAHPRQWSPQPRQIHVWWRCLPSQHPMHWHQWQHGHQQQQGTSNLGGTSSEGTGWHLWVAVEGENVDSKI